MLHYEITLYWSQETRALIAEVPELPGCIVDGETYQSALQLMLAHLLQTKESIEDIHFVD